MRVTKHNARGCKKSSQGFTPKHNDRDFDVQKADNVHADRMHYNRYLSIEARKWYSESEKGLYKAFDVVEADFYEKHFKKQFEGTQERYKAKRNYAKLSTFDEWRKQKLHCPEESVMQIGNVDEHAGMKDMIQIAHEFIKAERDYYKRHNIRCTVLDCAFHGDEAVAHVHERKIYSYLDSDGIEKIGQNECLKRSDLELPFPDKPVGRYNNLKMVVDADLRAILLDICEKHGLPVEREPDRYAKHNQSKEKVVADKERKQRMEYQEQILQEHNEEAILREADRIIRERAERVENVEEELNVDVEPVKHGKRNGKIGLSL